MPSVFETTMADQLKGSMNPAFGLSATYTGMDGGTGTAVPVRVQRGDVRQVEGRDMITRDVQSGTIIVLAADLAHVDKGGRFTVNGSEVWSIELTPVLKNGEFVCECQRQGATAVATRRNNA